MLSISKVSKFVYLMAFISFTSLLFQNCGGSFKSQSVNTVASQDADLNLLKTPTIAVNPIGENGLVNSNTLNITFEVSGIPANYLKSVTCQLSPELSYDCASKKLELQNLADKDYTLTINFETTSGIKSQSTVLFRKDSAPPILSVASQPSQLTNATSASFSFVSTDNLSGIDRTECSIDSQTFETCISPKILTGLRVGPHNLKIRSFDKAKNQSQIYSYDWNIDLNVPTISFSTTPTPATKNSSAEFSFSGSEIVSYECQIDNSTFATCSSPKNLSNLTAGIHIFKVRGKNAAGTNSSILEYSWTVDFSSPLKPTLAVNTVSISNLKSIQINFSSSDPQTGIDRYECSLNSSAFSVCESPKNYNHLNEGQQKFQVRATDKAGNVSEIAEYSWLTDYTPPAALVLKNSESAFTISTTATIQFSSNDLASSIKSYVCLLDSTPIANCKSDLTLQNLLEGKHVFAVKAIDQAGNESEISTTTWSVDLTPPKLNLTQKPEESNTNTVADINFTATDNFSGVKHFTCSLDGGSANLCVPPIKISSAVGEHKFTITAIDNVGNSSQSVLTWKTIEEPRLIPEYNSLSYDAIDFLKSDPTIFMNSEKSSIYVASACGVFETKDNGETFSGLKINYPGEPLVMSISSDRIYVATINGLYLSKDGGLSFKLILSVENARPILNAQKESVYPCSSTSLNSSFIIKRLAVKDNLVVVGSDSGLWVSNDAGETFNIPKSKSGDYILPPVTAYSIDIVDNEIYVTSREQYLDSAYVKTESGTCHSTNNVPPSGLIVSKDGGKNFVSLPSAGYRSTSVLRSRKKPNHIYSVSGNDLQNIGKLGFIKSTDLGNTFTESKLSPFQMSSFSNIDINTLIETPTALFAISQLANIKFFYRSLDEGVTWQEIKLNSSSYQELKPQGIVSHQGKVHVITNQGLFTSNDGGASFIKGAKFSSNFCTYPWWHRAESLASSQQFIYNSWGPIVSRDGGKSFVEMKRNGFNDLVGEFFASGNTLYVFGVSGKISVSTDGGDNFTGPFASYKDASSGFTLFSRDPNVTTPTAGLYISTDGTDQRSQLNSYFQQGPGFFITSALSIGNRIIASIWDVGVVVYENNVKIYENNSISSSGSVNGIRIRYVNGVVYVLGKELLRSTDNGLTFQKVLSAPKFPQDITSIDGVISLTGGDSDRGYLWQSIDNGASFKPLMGGLSK